MIIVLTGMPGSGKSYLATQLIYDAWKDDPDRKIFTNYPVRLGDKSTMIWEPEFVNENIRDSLVVIDEAYRDYNSRKFSDFSDNAHVTFATNRHNGNTFVFISQNVARLDTVIREIAEIWWISKVAYPTLKSLTEFDKWHPIWFKAELYDCLDSFKMKAMLGKNAAYKKKRWRFKKKVAEMYDTHYYGDCTDPPFEHKFWFNEPLIQEEKHGIRIRFSRLFASIRTLCRPYSDGHLRDLLVRCESVFRGRGRLGSVKELLSKFNPIEKRTRPRYDLWEPRGIVRHVIYANWMLWKPVFTFFGTLKRRVGLRS